MKHIEFISVHWHLLFFWFWQPAIRTCVYRKGARLPVW